MMTYQEIVNYIEEIPKFTTKHPLEHTKSLLAALGNPQNGFRVIHVAGTNGKGSTCAYLASMFKAGGISCGFFTSPHLVTIRERFQIDGELISEEDFVEAFTETKKVIDSFVAAGEGHPSYFETLFIMGMLYFKKKHVDYCVLETGLGGRLDATNSVEKPLATIITSISLDHTEWLGNTVTAIAGEKAGIIKHQVPIIYDGHVPEASAVIAAKAEEMEAPAYCLSESMYRIVSNTKDGIVFDFTGNGETVRLSIPYVAPYQMMNASLAYLTMLILQPVHGIPAEALQKGIASTKWPGRMETIMPGVVIDGAHNADGVARFVETAAHFAKDNEISVLFSAVSDKEYGKMIASVCREVHPVRVITTQVGGGREVPAGKLAEIFVQNGCSCVTAEPSAEKAFALALEQKGSSMLFCVGSLYLIGEIKTILARQEAKR